MNAKRTATRLQNEIRQNRPFRSDGQEAAIAILRTADVLRQRFAAVVEAEGITTQQYNVLRILRGAHPEPLPTLELGERLIERMPGITRLLDRLEAKGLVTRERSAGDRRQVHCRITAAGMRLLARLDAPMDQADDDVVAGLSARELATLTRLLEKVRLSGQA